MQLAWLSAYCRFVVTHQLTCPVHIVECPSGCLALPLSSLSADECLDAMSCKCEVHAIKPNCTCSIKQGQRGATELRSAAGVKT